MNDENNPGEHGFGSTRYGNDPNKPLLEWYFEKSHRSSVENTQDRVRRAIDDYNAFLQKKKKKPNEVTIDDAYEWLRELTDAVGASEQQSRSMWIRDFYNFCNSRGHSEITGNPIGIALNENPNLLDKPQDRDPHIISVAEMADFITSFNHPMWIAITTLLAKTTVRKAPIHNLDLYDVNIDHPACDWEVHPDIRHNKNYIHIPRDPEKGKEFRGEIRDGSNKTSVNRVIPLDDEARDALLFWLLIRPGELKAQTPLFRTLSPTNGRDYGDRITYGRIDKQIVAKAKEMGHWYEAYDDDNINPHYFRHWSTTILEERVENPTIVDMLRGDSGEKTRDRYTHWTENKEKQYLNAVPKFFEDDLIKESLYA